MTCSAPRPLLRRMRGPRPPPRTQPRRSRRAPSPLRPPSLPCVSPPPLARSAARTGPVSPPSLPLSLPPSLPPSLACLPHRRCGAARAQCGRHRYRCLRQAQQDRDRHHPASEHRHTHGRANPNPLMNGTNIHEWRSFFFFFWREWGSVCAGGSRRAAHLRPPAPLTASLPRLPLTHRGTWCGGRAGRAGAGRRLPPTLSPAPPGGAPRRGCKLPNSPIDPPHHPPVPIELTTPGKNAVRRSRLRCGAQQDGARARAPWAEGARVCLCSEGYCCHATGAPSAKGERPAASLGRAAPPGTRTPRLPDGAARPSAALHCSQALLRLSPRSGRHAKAAGRAGGWVRGCRIRWWSGRGRGPPCGAPARSR